MLEPMKFGVLGGMWFALLMAIQTYLELDQWTILRWIIATFVLIFASLLAYRNQSKQPFDFRLTWFSGFNVLIASQIIFSIIFFVLGHKILITESTLNIAEKSYVILIEFAGAMTVGLVVLSILAALLRKKIIKQ